MGQVQRGLRAEYLRMNMFSLAANGSFQFSTTIHCTLAYTSVAGGMSEVHYRLFPITSHPTHQAFLFRQLPVIRRLRM